MQSPEHRAKSMIAGLRRSHMYEDDIETAVKSAVETRLWQTKIYLETCKAAIELLESGRY